MKIQKLSFSAISGVMSRSEMKKIMAGSGGEGTECTSDSQCGTKTQTCSSGTVITSTGHCYQNTPGQGKKNAIMVAAHLDHLL